MLDEPEYFIGGSFFTQRPLVLGQVRRLMAILRDLPLTGSVSPADIAFELGERLPRAAAVVLIPRGCEDLSKKDDPEIASLLEWNMSASQVLEVVRDFFECNPVSSFRATMGEIRARLTGTEPTPSNSSRTSSANSPGAT